MSKIGTFSDQHTNLPESWGKTTVEVIAVGKVNKSGRSNAKTHG